jgi:hypothetical protein
LWTAIAINNFGGKIAGVVSAQSCGEILAAMKPSFYVMVFHMYNVQKLMVPMVLLL